MVLILIYHINKQEFWCNIFQFYRSKDGTVLTSNIVSCIFCVLLLFSYLFIYNIYVSPLIKSLKNTKCKIKYQSIRYRFYIFLVINFSIKQYIDCEFSPILDFLMKKMRFFPLKKFSYFFVKHFYKNIYIIFIYFIYFLF